MNIGKGQWLFFSMFTVLFLSSITKAEIYSWKDENGKTHFGDQKINHVNQKTIDLKKHHNQWKKFDIEINDVDGVLSPKEKQRIRKDVNTVYRFFDNILYFDIYTTVPVKIRLFADNNGYKKYLADTYNSSNHNSRGIYFPRTNEIVLFINEKVRWRTFWTIKHETSHAIVDVLTPYIPAWLNEGLAENMEAVTLKNDALILYKHKENHRNIARSHNSRRLKPLKDFLRLSSRDWRRQLQDSSPYYQTQAGELARMYLSTPTGINFLIDLIHMFERGERTLTAYLAEKHYIGGLKVMQNNFNAWASREKPSIIHLQ